MTPDPALTDEELAAMHLLRQFAAIPPSGRISEWPQFRPTVQWAIAEIEHSRDALQAARAERDALRNESEETERAANTLAQRDEAWCKKLLAAEQERDEARARLATVETERDEARRRGDVYFAELQGVVDEASGVWECDPNASVGLNVSEAIHRLKAQLTDAHRKIGVLVIGINEVIRLLGIMGPDADPLHRLQALLTSTAEEKK